MTTLRDMTLPSKLTPKDRESVEALMRAWNECYDSEALQSDPSFDHFGDTVKAFLLRLGMEWNGRHGYVFPWTDMVNGPFPMTGARTPVPSDPRSHTCSKMSLSTKHAWKAVGLARPGESRFTIRVIYACENCSSWTYHEMDFVGYKIANLQDRLDEDEDPEKEAADDDEDV